MQAHTTPGLSMSMSPVSFRLNPPASGAKNFAGHVTVTDSGTLPVTVHPGVMQLAGKTTCVQHGVPWLRVNVATFKLLPGQSRVVPFTVAYKPGLSGNAAVMAYGQTTGSHTVSASAGVGARVMVAGGQQACQKVAVVAPHTSSGFPTGVAIVIGLLFAVALAVGVVLFAIKRREV